MTEPYSIEDVVPHRHAMCLLDRVLYWDEESIRAELVVPDSGLFVADGGVPAWVGIEYMAQAIAAWAGYRARRAGGVPSIGFLLGSRRYSAARAVFPSGTRLQVHARCELLGDNGLGMFACQLMADGEQWAAANVSVYEPADALTYLENGQQ
ncbi:hotdog family protein [Stenotrophomonas mori]|uniref:Hotdog family protein n=1 Tax=Stenotrophomonas mori TaxID=2871096 RepID=A0ABT0SHX8_9GAMM|nr:hotdog family protein [Stenotrophomonas mori]MCL7714673.1 hotdog family protein [Stenotrophomonas mori]